MSNEELRQLDDVNSKHGVEQPVKWKEVAFVQSWASEEDESCEPR